MITPHPGMTPPPPTPSRPSSRPREVRSPPSNRNSMDITLPTAPAPFLLPQGNIRSGSRMETGSIDPWPKPAPVVAPTTCKSHSQATPVTSGNTPIFRCSIVTPGQVTPVTRVNAPEVLSHQITEASTTCKSPAPATPVISVNTPLFCWSAIIPGQVTPVTRVNAPEV